MSALEPALRVGTLLRTARTESGLTLEELSARARVGVRTLGDIERNRIARPHRRTIEALIEALEISDQRQAEIWAAARPSPSASPEPSSRPVVARVVGRVAEMADLERWLGEWRRDRSPGPVIISGLPGVGKSTLAQGFFAGTDGFPDGRLCIKLGGSTASPMEPATALGHLLEQSGVPREQVPDSADERGILFRRRMQELTMLIGLADARDEGQVRPLLADNTPSLLVVTTRRNLAGLPASKRVVLREPGPADAMALLKTMVGAERVDAEPGPAADLIRLCGHLPLALRVAATRLTTRPGATIADLVDRLSMPDDRLVRLTAGDLRLRDVLERHYRLLSADQQRTFRRLCLLRGPRLTAGAAARVLGIDTDTAEDALESLVDGGLLTPDGGQYLMNSLLRQLGREMLAAGESAASLSSLLESHGSTTELAGAAHRRDPRRAA